MDDLISRQAAIAEFSSCELTPDGGIDANYAIDFLKQMPPAQPDHIGEVTEMVGDAISRQAVWDALNRIEISRNASWYEFYQKALTAVVDLPPAQPGWIPCSERLPENIENSYWICTDTGYQCQCRWTNNVFGLGARNEWAWKLFDIPQYSRVVAWMPLPKPYREGGQDETD